MIFTLSTVTCCYISSYLESLLELLPYLADTSRSAALVRYLQPPEPTSYLTSRLVSYETDARLFYFISLHFIYIPHVTIM